MALNDAYGDDGYSQWIRRERTISGLQDQQPQAPTAPAPTAPPPPSPTTATGWGWSPTGQKQEFSYTPSATASQPGQYLSGMTGFMHDRVLNPQDNALKYIAARAMSSIDPKSPTALQDLVSALQAQGIQANISGAGSGTITFPQTGEVIDLLKGAPGGGFDSWQWMDLNDMAAQGGGGANTSTLGGLASALGGGGGPGGISGIPLGNTRLDTKALPTDPMQSAYREQVMRLLQRNPEDITLEETARLPQAQAYRAAAERGRRDRLAGEQERLASQGLESGGAADAALASGLQDMGTNVASYNANLMADEVAARRAELQSAIATAQQWGLADEANQLQRQLANLEAQTRKYGYDIQRELGLGGLNIQQQGLGLDAQRIANQNTQYYDQLGWNMAQYGDEANFRNYVLAMLAGQG